MGAEALIGGLASLVGSGFSAALGSQNVSSSVKKTKELMALQNQYYRENWQMENAYNSPKAQMARLKAAGLNPNLVYGSGAAGVSGLSGSIAPPTSPSSPVAPTPDFSSVVGDAINATVGMANAKKTNSESVYQDIQNQYAEKQIKSALRNLDSSTKVNEEQASHIIQSVKESQANIDALETRLGNETFDRVLSAMTTVGQLDYWKNVESLNNEQKRWLGTHAMAAMLGARGSYEQAHAMAEALNLFRDPSKFQECVHGYLKMLGDEIKSSFGGFLPKEVSEAIENWNNGNYFDALFGKGARHAVGDKLKSGRSSMSSFFRHYHE